MNFHLLCIRNDLTIRCLTEMCQKHRLGFVFLSDTKNRMLLLQNIQSDLGFDHFFSVEPLDLLFMDDLPSDANIMEHIASCRKALSQWRRQNNVNSEKLGE